jgi:DNA-directed RNA polymerase specialized sigma24 family protein
MVEIDSFATPDEVRIALKGLKAADMLRLRRFAQLRSFALPDTDWEDLLHDAVDRAIDGSRRWPRDIPFVVFMRESIRSVASNYWRRRATSATVSESDMSVHGQRATLDDLANENPDPEREVAARDQLAIIFDHFAADSEATSILEGLARGDEPADIQRSAGLTEVKYASAQRRIRRKLGRIFDQER